MFFLFEQKSFVGVEMGFWCLRKDLLVMGRIQVLVKTKEQQLLNRGTLIG